MTQRKTQTAAYWQNQFTIGPAESEAIQNLILEANRPLTVDEIALALVRQQVEAEEKAVRTSLDQGQLYRPQNRYEVGEKLLFPALSFAVGRVEYTRQGYHPEYGQFTVLGVKLENNGEVREFAAEFPRPEALEVGADETMAALQGLQTPEELFQQYGDAIRQTVTRALNSQPEFVEFHDQYFLRDLLVEVHEGLFNIADAAIDINQGPLPVDELVRQMDLLENGQITDLVRFSVNYRLANDDRFVDVGPKGQVLWYLRRLEPAEAEKTPPRLRVNHSLTYTAEDFDEETRAIIAEIDDETTNPEDIPATPPDTDTVTTVLTYPHWRVGTLPLTPRTLPFFPISYYNPVLFEFVDGRTGETFPGWSVYNSRYVFGLADWYQKHKLPAGAFIILKRTDDPLRVIVDYKPTRTRRDWIRLVGVDGSLLTFQINTHPMNCEYDDLMIIGDPNPQAVDPLWEAANKARLPLFDLLCQIFPELIKLNPQGTVHLKTVYSAVNVLRRFSPGVVLNELRQHACFIPLDHGYWTFDANLKDE